MHRDSRYRHLMTMEQGFLNSFTDLDEEDYNNSLLLRVTVDGRYSCDMCPLDKIGLCVSANYWSCGFPEGTTDDDKASSIIVLKRRE